MPFTLVNPYCTVAQVKEVLKRSDATKDDAIGQAVVYASRWIDQFMGRDFFLHDHTVTGLNFDESSDFEGNKLYLPYCPVISITSVVAAGTTLVSGTDYVRVTKSNGIEYLQSLTGDWAPYQPDGLVVVKGTFGYAQASSAVVPTGIPGHINWAAVEIAAAFSGENRKQVAGLDGQVMEVNTTSIPKSVFDVLGAHSIRSILV